MDSLWVIPPEVKFQKCNFISLGNVSGSEAKCTKALEKAPEVSPRARRLLEAISNPERYEIMVVLDKHKEGLSFSRLAQLFAANHNTLDRHLKVLTQSTLLWNFYERREEKDHSFYRLSTLGEKLLGDLKDEIELLA